MPYVKFCNLDSGNSALVCICQHCSLFRSVEITLNIFVITLKTNNIPQDEQLFHFMYLNSTV